MTIKTSRTDENAKIRIDQDKCSACGACVEVCKNLSFKIENGKLAINENSIFGCFGCGQCVAVCPTGAIKVEGRMLSDSDFITLPEKESRADYSQLYSVMLARRSVRDFKVHEVEDELVQKILEASSTSPMGIPPSDVGVLVLKGKEKVRQFSFDFIDHAKSVRWLFSPAALFFIMPFLSKDERKMFKTFITPLFDFLITRKEKGENWLLYDAPLAMYFYGSPFSDDADAYIAATYAMLAAETLGLGSCMIGSVHPLLKRGGAKLKKKYGIRSKMTSGIVVVFGYPKFKYQKAIKRSFGKVQEYA